VHLQVLLGGEVVVERLVLEDEADVAADVGRASVQSMLIVVLLPAPLGPRKPKTSPRATVRETPRTASISPYVLLRSSTSMAGDVEEFMARHDNTTVTVKLVSL
jgi:hypothetical protein